MDAMMAATNTAVGVGSALVALLVGLCVLLYLYVRRR